MHFRQLCVIVAAVAIPPATGTKTHHDFVERFRNNFDILQASMLEELLQVAANESFVANLIYIEQRTQWLTHLANKMAATETKVDWVLEEMAMGPRWCLDKYSQIEQDWTIAEDNATFLMAYKFPKCFDGLKETGDKNVIEVSREMIANYLGIKRIIQRCYQNNKLHRSKQEWTVYLKESLILGGQGDRCIREHEKDVDIAKQRMVDTRAKIIQVSGEYLRREVKIKEMILVEFEGYLTYWYEQFMTCYETV